MRIYLTVLLAFSLLLSLSSCRRSSVSNTSNPKSYQNNASAGSSKSRRNNKAKEKGNDNQKEKEQKHKSGAASDQAKKLIKTARSYTGTPYKYGGTSRAGLDCSGLTSLSYQSINVTIPRTSASQSAIGSAVDVKDIQPGDLVFFSDSKKNKKITHVGIVTEVSGDTAKFIHSSTQLGVVENELLSGYYYPLLVKIRRVL